MLSILRTAREMETETKAAIESEVVKCLEQAANSKEYKFTFADISLVPDWLCTKLIDFGYRVVINEELNTVEVSWENLEDVE